MNNPPQPQGDELDKASMLGADRGEPATRSYDVTALQGREADIASGPLRNRMGQEQDEE